MSARTSHRRAAGKKIRREKNFYGEKKLPTKKQRPVQKLDTNRDWDREVISAFAACEKCFGYSLTANGLCWSCSRGGDAA